jgi:hypothetical protein
MNLDIAAGRFEAARARGVELAGEVPESMSHMFDVTINAALGDRAAANAAAARIDTLPSGSLMLASITLECMCGAPFDLDATPKFRQRLEEAGVSWPPAQILPVAPPLD